MISDPFFNFNRCYERLVEDYKKHNSLLVAFDYDNTIYDYHKKGVTYNKVIKLLRELKAINCKLICWTAHEDLKFVEQYLKYNNIPFDGINVDGIKLNWETRKPFFSALLDDRAGLIQVYKDLKLLVKMVSTFYILNNNEKIKK